ncbi:MAG: amidohydrolase [Lachnospiraceae bacterium]|nr:amidohydrolase [Lachnospiraceae bacterium]
MKIIDAHLHFCPGYEHFDLLAKAAEHENTAEHLEKTYEQHEIVGGIVMGNRGMEPERHQYPKFLRYCIGVDRSYLNGHTLEESYDLIEENLKRPDCVGIKLYPGYNRTYITDEPYEPVYELAAQYKKPVAVHMGQTAGSKAYIKYSHPLTMDEAAVRHPDVQFVMCHFGNPWLMDAAAVVEKNENVAADLSGLLEGKVDFTALLKKQRGYLEILKSWIGYCDAPEKFMFGTDWPLANYGDYIEFVKWLIPKTQWEQVFYKTAANVYRIG